MTEDKKTMVILAEDQKELVFREGKASEIYQYNGYRYKLRSMKSLVEMVKKKAVKHSCVIAYTDELVSVILDDTIVDRPQDTLTYPFSLSPQAVEWKHILLSGSSFKQKALVDFLKRREPDEINDMDALMANVQRFRYVTNIQGDFEHIDSDNYSFMVKVADVEGTVKIPTMIIANIEILNESGFVQPVEIEVEVVKPKGENDGLFFNLTCPKYDRYLKAAVQKEVEVMEKELDGYLIVTGTI